MVLSSGPLHGNSGRFRALALTVKFTTFVTGCENNISMWLSFSALLGDAGVLGALLLPGLAGTLPTCEPGGDVTRRLGVENGGCEEDEDEERRRSMVKKP